MASSLLEACPIAGNSDLYGFGVRVGLYAQWCATLLATLFEPRNESMYRLANLIIQTAIFLGLCTQSTSESSVVGALITQYLLFGSLSSLTGDGISHFSHFSGIVRIFFYIALSSYGCWFWFNGIDSMSKPGCPDIAFFGRTDLHGGFRVLGKIVSAGGLIICVACLCFCLYATSRRFSHGISKAFQRPARKRPQVELGLLFVSMALIGVSATLIEYLVRVNHITDVGIDQIGSVSQLIPLLAGCLACALMLWRVIVHRLFLRKRCWFLFGYHL